jgi:hypothetical protein
VGPSTRAQELDQLQRERESTLQQYRSGEVDDGFLEEELARIRREKDRSSRQPAKRALIEPELGDLPAICDAARSWLWKPLTMIFSSSPNP